jgi:hypothetical protein
MIMIRVILVNNSYKSLAKMLQFSKLKYPHSVYFDFVTTLFQNITPSINKKQVWLPYDIDARSH